jgi:glycine betaine/choline ABC-type transport system substrate-binding protein
MDRTKIIAGLILVIALTGCGRRIRVASKDFTEQVVLGEIVAQHLENRLHQKIARSLNLGGTLLAQQALMTHEIDVYPEYSGTALTMVLKENASGDAAGVLRRVQSEYSRKFHLVWLEPLGINNGFAMVVRGADARAQGLKTLSDAARMSWTLGVGYEFERRADGLTAVKSVYGLQLKGSPITMNLGLLYKAIEQGQVDMIAASETDGMLSKMDLKILEDDRHAFPPYQVSLVGREDMPPEMRMALGELSGKFTNAKMQELNYLVDVEHRAVGVVAEGFLRGAGLK